MVRKFDEDPIPLFEPEEKPKATARPLAKAETHGNGFWNNAMGVINHFRRHPVVYGLIAAYGTGNVSGCYLAPKGQGTNQSQVVQPQAAAPNAPAQPPQPKELEKEKTYERFQTRQEALIARINAGMSIVQGPAAAGGLDAATRQRVTDTNREVDYFNEDLSKAQFPERKVVQPLSKVPLRD